MTTIVDLTEDTSPSYDDLLFGVIESDTYPVTRGMELIQTTPNVGVVRWHSANQSVSAATHTILSFDTVIYDTHGFGDPAVDATKITIPSGQAGKYIIGVRHRTSYISTGLYVYTYLYAGGNLVFLDMEGNGFGYYDGSTAHVLIDLAESDEIYVSLYIGSAETIYNTLGSAYLFAQKIGP